MFTNQPTVKSGFIETEGDRIFYEVRGKGKPLLMISPGGGDGWQYSFVADILASQYKVICYDRRANGRSTINHPNSFSVSQQSRDAVSVLQAVGEQSAYIFGNSSGAVIALDLITSHPDVIEVAVVHEPPLASIHPDREKWQRFFKSVYSMSSWLGASLAALRFAIGAGLPIMQLLEPTKILNKHKKDSSEPYIDSRKASKYLIEQELLPITNYAPDIPAIQRSGVPVFMAAGEESLQKKRFYAETAPVLADQIGCEMIVFPGHHGSFLDMPTEWAETLQEVLEKAVTTG
jgi:pimeloyl-ACP methyl ester carboxylesterase